MGRPDTEVGGRLAHLDGLRGVAILLVVLDHLAVRVHGEGLIGSPALAPFTDGQLGVLVFFVLSGYLITGILLRERARSGRVSLRDFYARRALRIWPALYVFLSAMLVIDHASGVVEITGRQMMFAGLYLWPYMPGAGGGAWWLGHTWSLSVEEVFYLCFPLALVALSPRRVYWAAVGVIALEPLVRLVHELGHLGPADRIAIYPHTRADALLIGACVALLPLVHPGLHARLRTVAARPAVAAAAIGGLVASAYVASAAGDAYRLPVGMSVEALCVAFVLLSLETAGPLRRALSFRPLVLLGLVSYSLYLWQEPFLAQGWTSGVMGSTALAPLLALACAITSYRLVERPFLRLKDLIARRPSAEPRPATAHYVERQAA